MRIFALVIAVVGMQLHGICLGQEDARFRRLAAELIDEHMQAHPLDAVDFGRHDQDGRFLVPDSETLAAEQRRLARASEALAGVDVEKLSAANRFDWRLLRQAVDKERWRLEVQRRPWRNPMHYARANEVSTYLKRDFKPLDERVKDMTAILRQAPATFAAARANLEEKLPQPFVESAIKIAQGTEGFLENDVPPEIAAVKDAAVRRDFELASSIAKGEFPPFAPRALPR